jgi:hypothetical protein
MAFSHCSSADSASAAGPFTVPFLARLPPGALLGSSVGRLFPESHWGLRESQQPTICHLSVSPASQMVNRDKLQRAPEDRVTEGNPAAPVGIATSRAS